MVPGNVTRRFDAPDETRVFEKGKFDRVTIGGMTVGRARYEPGWKWSTHVRPVAQTPLCMVEHIGLVVSGRAKVLMKDGTEIDLRPGDLFSIDPGHDSWVVGDEPYVSLHFLGADSYAR
jgi:quercetin dioxygenase-like cupin family protein